MVNWADVAWAGLDRLHHQLDRAPFDEALAELVRQADAALAGLARPIEPSSGPVMCLWVRIGEQVIKTVGVAARFDPVAEVALDELRIELTYPLDDIADRFFREALTADTAAHPGRWRGPVTIGNMITTIYLVALVVSVGAALVARWAAVRLRRARPYELSPGEIGYLAGGPERAVLAELGRQRDRRPDSARRALDRLGAAIYTASAPVERDPGVRTALAGIRRDLGRSGLLVSVPARRLVHGSAILVLAIAASGLTRYIVGAATGHPAGYLPATIAGSVVGVALLGRAPFRTRAGDLVLRGLSAGYPAGPAAANPNAFPQTGYRDIGGGYGP